MKTSLMMTSAAAATLGVFVASGAYAADLYVPPPVEPIPAPVFDWTGVYIGGHAGYGWGNADWRFEDDGFFADSGDTFDDDPDGFFGGGQLGYNHQFGDWVAGLEATFSGSDIKDSSASPFFPDEDTLKTRITYFGTLTGRVGWAWDRVMLYGKGGLAYGRIKIKAESIDCDCAAHSSKTHVGWTVGAGLEYLVTQNIVMGVEYNYHDFGSKRHSGIDDDGDSPGTVKADVELHTIAARLSYKF